MLLRYFYDEKLSHASYLVGCQATGEAMVIDPARNIEPYLDVADREGLRIVAAAETHIHADFVSGARELADRVGATLYLSDEGDEHWKYQYLDTVFHRLVKDGDTIQIGNIRLEVMHTPGHTPEHISLVLYDLPTTDKPIGIFTGDFVFVGDVGRPDLLEEAAGIKGTAVPGARQMFRSLQRFRELPDHVQVWPAHGAGSACGKALGAVPSSTVGYERLTNWALMIDDEETFVKELLADQPEPPKYFKHMKRINKEGPALLRELQALPRLYPAKEIIDRLLHEGAQIVDTRPAEKFAAAHLKGSINIPLGKSFTNWSGWLIDYDRPLYVIAGRESIDEVRAALFSIGIDNVEGYIDPGFANPFRDARLALDHYASVEPSQVKDRLGEYFVLDVRNKSERKAGHIDGAQHIMLGYLPDRLNEVPKNRPILVHCELGGRSAIAASILKAHGYEHVYNLAGGYARFKAETHAP
ncbi:MAG: MBL fold metallo-hydrolase [Hydrogenibacillus sp.]|nr:MBL fold metallo-hydrolase [Hydrogenibacillus sp.]